MGFDSEHSCLATSSAIIISPEKFGIQMEIEIWD